MKKVYILFISMIMSTCLGEYNIPTERVAVELEYPLLYLKLRNRVQDFLKETKISMLTDIQELRAQDLNYRAEQLRNDYRNVFDALKERFDEEFEVLDKEFLSAVEMLDAKDAPKKEKARVIKNLKQEAQGSIDALLQQYQKKSQGQSRRN